MLIGVDPGPVTSTAVWWDGERVHRVVEERASKLAYTLAIESSVHATFACEWVECYGMAVGREVFETVFMIGALASAVPMRLVPRRDVKLHLCQSSRAKDTNIRQAILDRFGPVGTKKNPGPLYGVSKHAWAALAVAITAYDIQKTDHEATFHN